MKIYDCFQFFDENMILDLRLNVLNDFVSKFIIVESKYLHSGTEKKPVFDIKNFSKFKDKIIYILVDKMPERLHDINESSKGDEKDNKIIDNALKFEINQRNAISKGLSDAEENDLIIVSDVDEIPNLKDNDLRGISRKIIQFKQKMYYYKFNLRYTNKSWFGSRACLKKYLITPQWLRETKQRKYPVWRFDILFSKKKYNNIHHVENGGWHFVNIKTPEDIEKKLKNFIHHLEFEESGLNLSDIRNMVNEQKAIYDYDSDMRDYKWSGKIKLETCGISELPDYLINNKNKYSAWLK